MTNRNCSAVLASVLVSCLVLNGYGCAAAPANDIGAESSGAPLTLADYNTKDLMMGLVLMDGPVAELVPTIRDNWSAKLHVEDPALLAARREFAGRVLDKVVAEHPADAHAFRAGVLSGDHLKIQQSTHDVAFVIGEVAKSFPEYQESPEGANGVDGRGLCAVLNVAVAFNFAIGAAVAVALAVVAVNQLYVYSNVRFGGRQPSTESGEASSVLSDQATDEIAALASAT